MLMYVFSMGPQLERSCQVRRLDCFRFSSIILMHNNRVIVHAHSTPFSSINIMFNTTISLYLTLSAIYQMALNHLMRKHTSLLRRLLGYLKLIRAKRSTEASTQ